MLRRNSKWTNVFLAFHEARRRTRAVEERETPRFTWELLMLLLGASLVALISLLVRRIL